MSNDWCEPAASLIKRLGGISEVAHGIGKPIGTVQRWQRPRVAGGTGGMIPHWHHEAVVAFALTKRIRLKPKDFVKIEGVVA